MAIETPYFAGDCQTGNAGTPIRVRGLVTFVEVWRVLEARGWRCDAETLFSPSNGFWFDRGLLERDVLAVYASAARRVYTFGRPPESHELHTLLDALCGDPRVARLAEHLAFLRSELSWLATSHAMTLSLWTSGDPSIRAEARHPSGGVALIECSTDVPPNLAEGPASFELYASHWIDDDAQHARFSRSKRFDRLSGIADLRQPSEDAVAFLLSSPDLSAFVRGPRAALTEGQQAIDDEWRAALQILR